MKKRIILLFAFLTVVALLFAACSNPGVNDYQKIKDLLKVNYSKVTVVVTTQTSTLELNGSFTLTKNGNSTNIDYKFERVNSFEVGSDGSIADANGDFIVVEEGTVTVSNGQIVDGDENVDIPFDELNISGFSFKQAFFKNAKLNGAKLEADVVNAQQFTGNAALNCKDMHVVVVRNTKADTLTSIELTYTSENGAAVKISYLFTK